MTRISPARTSRAQGRVARKLYVSFYKMLNLWYLTPRSSSQNKTNSAVQLIHKPTGIVVKSQATRSRSQNQKIAKEILAAKVEALERGEQSREAIKIALKKKRKASSMKKKRRKYRALEEAKHGQHTQDDVHEVEEAGFEYEETKTTATTTTR